MSTFQQVGPKRVADLGVIFSGRKKSQERLTGYHQYINNLLIFEANVKSWKISEMDKNKSE